MNRIIGFIRINMSQLVGSLIAGYSRENDSHWRQVQNQKKHGWTCKKDVLVFDDFCLIEIVLNFRFEVIVSSRRVYRENWPKSKPTAEMLIINFPNWVWLLMRFASEFSHSIKMYILQFLRIDLIYKYALNNWLPLFSLVCSKLLAWSYAEMYSKLFWRSFWGVIVLGWFFFSSDSWFSGIQAPWMFYPSRSTRSLSTLPTRGNSARSFAPRSPWATLRYTGNNHFSLFLS